MLPVQSLVLWKPERRGQLHSGAGKISFTEDDWLSLTTTFRRPFETIGTDIKFPHLLQKCKIGPWKPKEKQKNPKLPKDFVDVSKENLVDDNHSVDIEMAETIRTQNNLNQLIQVDDKSSPKLSQTENLNQLELELNHEDDKKSNDLRTKITKIDHADSNHFISAETTSTFDVSSNDNRTEKSNLIEFDDVIESKQRISKKNLEFSLSNGKSSNEQISSTNLFKNSDHLNEQNLPETNTTLQDDNFDEEVEEKMDEIHVDQVEIIQDLLIDPVPDLPKLPPVIARDTQSSVSLMDKSLNHESSSLVPSTSLDDESSSRFLPSTVDHSTHKPEINSNSHTKTLVDESLIPSVNLTHSVIEQNGPSDDQPETLKPPNVIDKTGHTDDLIEETPTTPLDSSLPTEKPLISLCTSSISPINSVPNELDDHTETIHNTTSHTSESIVQTLTTTDIGLPVGDKFTLKDNQSRSLSIDNPFLHKSFSEMNLDDLEGLHFSANLPTSFGDEPFTDSEKHSVKRTRDQFSRSRSNSQRKKVRWDDEGLDFNIFTSDLDKNIFASHKTPQSDI